MTEFFSAIPNRREIFNRRAVVAALDAMAETHNTPETLRQAFVALLKERLTHGRSIIRDRLIADNSKGRIAATSYAFLTEQVVRLLFELAATRLFARANPTEAERLALASVGGFGRGEMAPFSDVDILFLIPYKQTPWTEQVVETVLYSLWDLGLKVGYATRSITEMVALARQDVTIRTSLLEARYLSGDQTLYETSREAFYAQVVKGSEAAFITQKLTERDERHKRMGESRYVVEPNLKDGIGGLRDLHTLFWIGKYLHRARNPAELVDKGLLTPEELRTFLKAEDFLWTVRCHLHDLVGRAEERLTFDVQPELARRLNYADRTGVSGVERFMKHYFLTAKQVGDLTSVFLAQIEDRQRKKSFLRMPRITRRPRKLDGFVLEQNRLNIPEEGFFAADPLRLIQIFHLAQQYGLAIHPTAMRQAGRDARLIKAAQRKDPAANALFLDILTSTDHPEDALRMMNEAGVFGRFVPDFGRVVAQMQFDMYHHYTVDEHTIHAIGLLARIERGELNQDHPMCSVLIPKIVSRRVLYVAVLLHDIAKGRGGDHSVLGAQVATKLCPRLGLTPAETETVSWLVRHHLLMSSTAFKRDLTDYKTILDFSEIVQSPERLKLLLVLTVVDIRAVGPNVWNAWKGQLLKELYEASEELLLLGHKTRGRTQRIAEKKQSLQAALGWSQKAFQTYARNHLDPYWVAEPSDVLFLNAEQVRRADGAEDRLSVAAVAEAASGTTLVTVYAPDHAGLFFRIAGAISLAGANIVGARIHTTRDGMALDNLTIQDPTGGPYADPAQLTRLRETVRTAITGSIRLFDRLSAKKPRKSRAESFKVAPRVLVDNKASNRFTLVEVNALDRPALLFSLTFALFQAKVMIHSAHISTFGERVVDVFYITDLTNEKIINTNRLKAIERRLLSAVDGKPIRDTAALAAAAVD